jgi:hypothetical protein
MAAGLFDYSIADILLCDRNDILTLDAKFKDASKIISNALNELVRVYDIDVEKVQLLYDAIFHEEDAVKRVSAVCMAITLAALTPLPEV